MSALTSILNRIRSWVLSLWKQSFASHSSVRVTQLPDSVAFYQRLGFRKVRSSRGDEVVLLRSHQGAELNLVPVRTDNATSLPSNSISFEVANLASYREQISEHVEIVLWERDATSHRLVVCDPDSNRLEFYELIPKEQRSSPQLYHVASNTELTSGLSQHYYMPPMDEKRFLYCPPQAAIAEIVVSRVARDTNAPPFIIELDQNQVSVEEEWEHEGREANPSPRLSTYPHVHSPIPRSAIVAIGRCEGVDGSYGWPRRFAKPESLPLS